MKSLSPWCHVRVAVVGACLIASVATSVARAEETFRIAISPGVDAAFGSDIRATLSEMGKLNDGKYQQYEKRFNVHTALFESFPTEEFDVLITSDADLPPLPVLTLHVEDGRQIQSAFAFILLAKQQMAMELLKQSKVAYPSFQSFHHFFIDVVEDCIFSNTSKSDRPTPLWKEDDIFETSPPDIDVLVVKATRENERAIGASLLSKLISNHWRNPLSIPFYSSQNPQTIQKFGDCLADKKSGPYKFTNRPGTNFSRILPGVRLESTSVQTVERDDTIKIVAPESVWSDKEFSENFFKDLYVGLEHRKQVVRHYPSNRIERRKLKSYVRGYELLTYTLRGVLESAEIRFTEAADKLRIVKTLQPFQRIVVQLSDREPLKPEVVAAIDDTISAYYRGFKKLEELPRERITLISMRARVMLANLYYMRHQHALLTDDPDSSCSNLEKAHKLIEALQNDVDTVKTVNDFDYDILRFKDEFSLIEDHYLADPLQTIARIKTCGTS